MATITSLGFQIFSRYSGAGLVQARRDLSNLRDELNDNVRHLNTSAQAFRGLQTAALALGPALIPVGAAMVAVGGAATSMAVSAGAALGAYGVAMKGAIQNALKLAEEHKRLNPVQAAFVRGVNEMKGSWQTFIRSTEGMTLKTATVGVQGITAVIKGLAPIVRAVHPEILKVAEAFKRWAEGDGLKRFIDIVIQHGVPALRHLIAAGKDVLATLGIGFRAFAPLGVDVAQALEKGAAAMRKWAEGGGFQRFIENVRANAPQVKEFFSALVAALANVGRAFAGLGPLALGLSTALLKIIAAMPPEVIQAIVVAILAWRAAMLGLMIFNAIAAGVTALRAAWTALSASFIASPLGLVITALVALGAAIYLIATRTTWFQTAWQYTWNFIKTVGLAIWNALKAAWEATVNGLITAWNAVSGALTTAWNAVWNGLKTAFDAVWNAIKLAFNVVVGGFIIAWNIASAPFVAAWNAVWNGIKAVFDAVWDGIRVTFNLVVGFFITVWNLHAAVFSAAWNAFWNAISAVARGIWSAMQAAWNAFVSIFQTGWAVASAVFSATWNAFWTAISTVARAIWTALTAAWNAFVNGLSVVWNTVSAALRTTWTAVWNALSVAARAVWTALTAAWNAFINGLSVVWNTVSAALRAAWTATWNALSAAAQAVWNAMRVAWDAAVRAFQVVWAAVSAALSASWNAVWNALRATGTAVWNAMRAAWDATLRAMQAVWTAVSSALSAAWNAAWNAMRNAAQAVWNAIRTAWQGFLNVVQSLWNGFISVFRTSWQNGWNWVRDRAQEIWNFIRTLWTGFLNVLQSLWNAFISVFRESWRNGWNWVRDRAQEIWNFIRSLWQGFLNVVQDIWNRFISVFRESWRNGWNWVRDRANEIWNFIRGLWSTFTQNIQDIWNRFISAFRNSWSDGWNWVKNTAQKLWNDIGNVIEKAINGIIKIVNGITGGFNKIAGAVGLSIKIPEIPTVNFAYGGITGMPKDLSRTGGYTRGFAPGRDKIPAMLSPGEGVLVPEAVRGLGGPSFITQANNHFSRGRTGKGGPTFGPPKFANGGMMIDDATHFARGGIMPAVQHFAVGGITAAALARAGIPLSQVMQGEFSNSVAASAGTHSGGGAVDIRSTSPAVLQALINAGFAAWIRGPAQGMTPHIHAVLMNHPQLSPQARAQVAEFRAGGDGLNAGGGGGGGGGGILGAIANFISGIVGKFGDVGNFLLNVAKGTVDGSGVGGMLLGMLGKAAIEKAFGFARDLLGGFNNPAGNFGKILIAMVEKIIKGMIDYITKEDEKKNKEITALSVAGAQSVQAWAPLAARALQIAGLAANQLPRFLALMQAESGGNPNAINRTDINAQRGIPSQGLMQVIPPTFAAYRDPSLPNNILDPLANMVAAARYIKARYGGVVPGSPYAMGTPGAARGLHLVGENGPELAWFRGGERVTNNRDLVGALRGGRGGDVHVNMPISVQGNLDHAAVDRLETEVVPKMRMMLQQQIGRRN